MATGYLATLGHLLGGGDLPDAATVLVVAAMVGLAVSGLARRRGTLLGISAVVVASQLAFHAIFSITAHADHGAAALGGGAARMALFHLLGAAVTVAALHRGEQAIHRTFAVLRRVLPTVVAPAPLVAVGPTWCPRPVESQVGAANLPAAPMLRAHGRRGPPVGF